MSFTDTPLACFLQSEQDGGVTGLIFGIGLTVDAKGKLRSLAREGPAFRAGLVIGMRIVAVNGNAFSPERLEAAIEASSQQPVRLSIEAERMQSTLDVPCRGSLRCPHLLRLPGTVDGLATGLGAAMNGRLNHHVQCGTCPGIVSRSMVRQRTPPIGRRRHA